MLSPPKSEMEESIDDNNVERCDDKFRSSKQKSVGLQSLNYSY